jgi:hypothetical protein
MANVIDVSGVYATPVIRVEVYGLAIFCVYATGLKINIVRRKEWGLWDA